MRTSNNRILALLFACVLAVSMFAHAVGASMTGESTNADEQFSDEQAPIDSELKGAHGTVEVVVRFGDVESGATKADDVAALKRQAAESQAELERLAHESDELTILNQFWLANAALVEVDVDGVDLSLVARLEGVSELHPNFEVRVPDVATDTAANETTYGLDQIDAPDV